MSPSPISEHDKRTLIEQLASALAPDRVLTEPDALDLRAWDALSAGRIHPSHPIQHRQPVCVCLPSTTVEVQAIVLLANELRIPIVPYGGGSGLMGGAISLRPGIVVDLRGMDRILEIDVGSRTACVQAGVVLERLQGVLGEHDLTLGHDPWTLPVATVGGTVSTNSLGYRGGKYGSMGDEVLGLEAVLPGGQICRTRAVGKSSTGIDLKHLFIGGEGCFGILTEVTLRVFPKPAMRSLHGFRFGSFKGGFGAVSQLFCAGLSPSLMDYGDATHDARGPARLYLGFEGTPELVKSEAQVAADICTKNGGEKLPPAEVEAFWRDRHAVARRFMKDRRERRREVSKGWYRDWIHVALPAAKILEFREHALETISRRGVEFRESGLWTSPELFSFSMAKHGGKEARAAVEESIVVLLEAVHGFGGSMEYCHGVGTKLAPLMRAEHDGNLDLMRSMKKWIDPNRIMNPGKLGL